MNRSDHYKRAEDIEIDLLDFMRSFCLKWKQIAVCALAGALFLGGYAYFRISNDGVPEELMQEEAELTEEEQQEIAEAVQLKKDVDGMEAYAENSVLMQIDASQKDRVLLLYCIETAGLQKLQRITESYVSYLTYGKAADDIQKANENFKDIKSAYLTELISSWQVSASQNQMIIDDAADAEGEKILYVEVTGKDAQMADRLAQNLQKALAEYSASVRKTCGSHKLTLLGSMHNVRFDSALLTQQREKRELLKTGRTNLKTMTESMNRNQQLVYEKETGIEKQDDSQKAADMPSGFSVKYMVFGFCGGILAYGCFFLCMYLLRGAVRSENEFKTYYSFPLYGKILLKKASYGHKNKYEYRLEQTLGRVRIACKKQGIQKLCLTTEFSAGVKETELMERISKQLQEWGIQTVIGKNPGSDISQWEILEKAGTVLLACHIGVTTYSMINSAVEFYLENDINVMGAVLLDGR